MQVMVVYDSVYGNTEDIAKSIGGAINGEVKVLRPTKVDPAGLGSIDLLIAGSPTYGGRPTPAMLEFLNTIPAGALKGVNVATFDTRLTAKWVVIFGYAAGRIARVLKRKGGAVILAPEGFFVEGTKGPLKQGELERAADWIKTIVP